MAQRFLRILFATVIVLGAVAVAETTTASPAAALCAPNPLGGDWHNINASTSSMSRVVVEPCASVRSCSGNICSITFDAATFMTPYGKCSPTDCNWGRKQVQYMSDGWIRAVYNFGFKTSSVWARSYEYYGRTYLRLWVDNDFTTADGRTDYTTDEWFLK